MGGRYSTWGKKGCYCFNSYPVIEIQWTNWDSKLICSTKGKVSRLNPYSYGEKKHKPGVSLEDIGYLVNTSKFIKNSRLAIFRISKYSSMKGISYASIGSSCCPNTWEDLLRKVNRQNKRNFKAEKKHNKQTA